MRFASTPERKGPIFRTLALVNKDDGTGTRDAWTLRWQVRAGGNEEDVHGEKFDGEVV